MGIHTKVRSIYFDMSCYLQSRARSTVAHILRRQGFELAEESALEALASKLSQYLRMISQTLHRCIEHAGRTNLSYDDILTAFHLIGIDIKEIQRFLVYNKKYLETSVQFLKPIVLIKSKFQKNRKTYLVTPIDKQSDDTAVFSTTTLSKNMA